MSDYEFLGRVTIGNYLPVDSLLHRVDARGRLLIFTFILLALTAAPRLGGLALGLALALVGLRLARVPLRHALSGLVGPLPFLIILALIQVFFLARPELSPAWWQWGPLALTPLGLLAGAALLVRFCALILLLSLATFCLSPTEMIRGLYALLRPLEKLGAPVRDVVMVVQVMLRFLPLLAQSAERVARAQAARGGQWGSGRGGLIQRARQVIPLLIPLFLLALRRAERMALAMDARGYGNPARPTSMVELHFRRADGFWVAGSLALAVLIVIL